MTTTVEPTITEKAWKPPTWLVLEHPRPIPCQRTTCADEPHDAREHLDPRHAQYDGPYTLFNALPGEVKDAARQLWGATDGAPEVVDLARYIYWLRDQVAHVRVDADRKVLEASERALDCTDHGRVIAEAEKQAHHFSERADQMDKARVALLPFPQAVRELVDNMRQRQKLGHEVPTVNDLLTVLDQAVKKAFAAHDRAVK